jgi:hypothetical protein
MPFDTAKAAKEIADGVVKGDRAQEPGDTLTAWERSTYFSATSVQLRIPLLDPKQAEIHVKMVIAEMTALLVHLQHSPPDRHALKATEGTVKALNRKLNAYRRPRG